MTIRYIKERFFKAFILFIFRFVTHFKLIVVGLSTSYSILALWSSRSCEGISEGHTQYHFVIFWTPKVTCNQIKSLWSCDHFTKVIIFGSKFFYSCTNQSEMTFWTAQSTKRSARDYTTVYAEIKMMHNLIFYLQIVFERYIDRKHQNRWK